MQESSRGVVVTTGHYITRLARSFLGDDANLGEPHPTVQMKPLAPLPTSEIAARQKPPPKERGKENAAVPKSLPNPQEKEKMESNVPADSPPVPPQPAASSPPPPNSLALHAKLEDLIQTTFQELKGDVAVQVSSLKEDITAQIAKLKKEVPAPPPSPPHFDLTEMNVEAIGNKIDALEEVMIDFLDTLTTRMKDVTRRVGEIVLSACGTLFDIYLYLDGCYKAFTRQPPR